MFMVLKVRIEQKQKQNEKRAWKCQQKPVKAKQVLNLSQSVGRFVFYINLIHLGLQVMTGSHALSSTLTTSSSFSPIFSFTSFSVSLLQPKPWKECRRNRSSTEDDNAISCAFSQVGFSHKAILCSDI